MVLLGVMLYLAPELKLYDLQKYRSSYYAWISSWGDDTKTTVQTSGLHSDLLLASFNLFLHQDKQYIVFWCWDEDDG